MMSIFVSLSYDAIRSNKKRRGSGAWGAEKHIGEVCVVPSKRSLQITNNFGAPIKILAIERALAQSLSDSCSHESEAIITIETMAEKTRAPTIKAFFLRTGIEIDSSLGVVTGSD